MEFHAWLASFETHEQAARNAFEQLIKLRAETAYVPASQPPDSDILVLMSMSDGEVYPGYLDGEVWRYADAMPVSILQVLAWRHMPAGHLEAVV